MITLTFSPKTVDDLALSSPPVVLASSGAYPSAAIPGATYPSQPVAAAAVAVAPVGTLTFR